jgi:cell division protein FtsQ
MKKVLKIVLRIVLIITLLYIVIIPVYLANSTDSVLCRGIAIDLKDSSDLHFVTRRQLLNAASAGSEKIIGKPIKNISLTLIEGKVNVMRELKAAEAYSTIDGTIHIYADQRDPVMRVMPETGGDFFVDREGYVFRKRNLYTPRLHIVEGNVNITPAMLSGVSVLDTSIKNSILKDIFHIVDYIGKDDFWSAQIDQIYVDGKDEIDLLPRAGSQVVHLGTAENLEGKLRNLEAFYEKVLPQVGWNKYSVINLEFKDQIVCKRR